MAWQTLKYRLTSQAPLLMHNGRLADPVYTFTKQIKTISGKRKKTDADLERLAELEFCGSLYMGPTGPVIPASMIEAMVIRSAMKMREGPAAKSGCFALQAAQLEYDGPRDMAELWNAETFRFSCRAKVGQASIMRMRPRFEQWSATVELNIEDSLVNPAQVDAWMRIGGTQIGIGDWRPQFGRFDAERIVG